MADYDNTNSGAMFKSKSYEEGGNKPYYKGKIDIEGVEYELAAWVRTAKTTGNKFLSLKASLAQPKEPDREEHPPLVGDEVPY